MMGSVGAKVAWGDSKTVKQVFGLCPDRVREFVDSGAVRSVKFGESRQAGRLYCLGDIERALLDLAEGRELRRPRREARRTPG